MLRILCFLALLAGTAAAQPAPGTAAAQLADAIPAPVPAAPAAEIAAPAPIHPPAVTLEEPPPGHYDAAVLQGLNKVTARIMQLEVPVGAATRFGNLEIVVRRCWSAPQTERPENAALLEITERRPNEMPEIVYQGWMFSSSPSLAGLEHPVYDVTVLACERRKLEGEL